LSKRTRLVYPNGSICSTFILFAFGWQGELLTDKSADPTRYPFGLRAGSYATMVLRELLQGEDYQTMLKAMKNAI
jgi:tRNA(Glu) U13 pseudouridine synthase TruD